MFFPKTTNGTKTYFVAAIIAVTMPTEQHTQETLNDGFRYNFLTIFEWSAKIFSV